MNDISNIQKIRKYNQSLLTLFFSHQAMAIATLCVVYNNPKVLEKVVKIRKGEAVLLIEQCNDFAGTVRAFAQYSRQIRQKVDKSDPTATQLLEALDELDESIESFQS